MLKCKSMYTPMETKLKLLVDTLSELVDATLYRQIIGSVMYLMNTRPDICFALSQYLVEPKRVHLDDAKHVMRTLRVHWILVSTILEIMTSDSMDILIQIELEVFLIERALQDVDSLWGQS
jgi:hypothetical protein